MWGVRFLWISMRVRRWTTKRHNQGKEGKRLEGRWCGPAAALSDEEGRCLAVLQHWRREETEGGHKHSSPRSVNAKRPRAARRYLIAEFLIDVDTLKAKTDPRAGCSIKKRKWKSSPLEPHIYDSESKYFLLEKGIRLLHDFFPDADAVLRHNFHEQVKFLRERVLKEGHLGWILVRQETGKSMATIAFALTVDRNEWQVIWIHVEMPPCWRCIRLIGDERTSRNITNVKELK